MRKIPDRSSENLGGGLRPYANVPYGPLCRVMGVVRAFLHGLPGVHHNGHSVAVQANELNKLMDQLEERLRDKP